MNMSSKVELEPNLWIVFRRTRDDLNRKIMKFWGITGDKLEVGELTDDGWTCVRVGRDWEEMEVMI